MAPNDMPNAAPKEKVAYCLTGSAVDGQNPAISVRESRCTANHAARVLASVAALADWTAVSIVTIVISLLISPYIRSF